MLAKLKRIKDESGQAAIIAAFAFVIVCGMLAFVIDYGAVTLEKSNLQNAIDAACLSAAQDLPDTVKATDSANKYISLNGYDASDILITFSDSNSTINITGSKTVAYTFAGILGIENTTVNARAAATREMLGGPFDYTLFSGDADTTLAITGSGQYVGGNAHSNSNFTMTGSSQTITGSAESVSQFSITGSSITIGGTCQGSKVSTTGSNISIGTKVVSPAPFVDMPDFSDQIKKQAEASGQVYMGDITLNGSGLNVDHSIYVDGNVTVNGNNFFGKGCILATGNITFVGTSLVSTPGDAVCFYSENGNISITGSNATIDGILYAPNGRIAITGTNVTINGRVIGNTLSLTGSKYRIVGGTDDLNSLSAGSVKLTK